MKRLICALALISLIAACKKNNTAPVSTSGAPDNNAPVKPVLNMYVNDTFWQGSDPYGGMLLGMGNQDTLYSVMASGAASTGLELDFKKMKPGRQSLDSRSFYKIGRIKYLVDTGSVTIDIYNSIKKQVSGSFQLRVISGNNSRKVTKGFFTDVSIF